MIKPSRKTHTKKLDIGKTLCQTYHAKKRAKERLNIKLTDEMIQQITSAIKNRLSLPGCTLEFVENQSNRLAMYYLKFGNKEANLIFDKIRSTIVTFLPINEWKDIYSYYDVFNNKINVKSTYGSNWKLFPDGVLEIPGDEVVCKDGIWEVISGVLEGKRFKLYNDELSEIM